MFNSLLRLGGNGGHASERAVLIPGIAKPSSGEGNGQTAAGHKAIVVGATGGRGRGAPVSCERLQHDAWITGIFRYGLVKNG